MMRHILLSLTLLGTLSSVPGQAAAPTTLGRVAAHGTYVLAATAATLLSHSVIERIMQKLVKPSVASDSNTDPSLSDQEAEERKALMMCGMFVAHMLRDMCFMQLWLSVFGPAVVAPWLSMAGTSSGTFAKMGHVLGSLCASSVGFMLNNAANHEVNHAWTHKAGRVKNFCKALLGTTLSSLGNCWLGAQLGARAVTTKNQLIKTGSALIFCGIVGHQLLSSYIL